MKKIVLIFAGAFFIAACGIIPWRSFSPGPMMGSGNGWWDGGNYDSNGERIYFTATNEKGERIRYSDGPDFGGMMGNTNLSCASCHGPDGSGGIHTMHMDVMDAPDIRLKALSAEIDEHAIDQHTDGHGEYDFGDFYQAVVEGQHPDGDTLDRDMPRWEISDDDLDDLFEFIVSLP
jgi:hypothetical protein